MVIQLAIGIVLVIGTYAVGTHPETREFAKVSQESAVLEEKTTIDPPAQVEAIVEPPTAPVETTTEVAPVKVKVTDSPPLPEPKLVSQPDSNQDIIWNRLISAGYSREQTAAIMGNLQQEHNFKTADVPGGLGIAQWMGGRRQALINRGNYLDINVQLDYLIHELNTSENRAKQAILASGLEGATVAFQNLFERCNPYYCHQNQRIQYAYAILARY